MSLIPKKMVEKLDELLDQPDLCESIETLLRDLADELDNISSVTWSDEEVRLSLINRFQQLTERAVAR